MEATLTQSRSTDNFYTLFPGQMQWQYYDALDLDTQKMILSLDGLISQRRFDVDVFAAKIKNYRDRFDAFFTDYMVGRFSEGLANSARKAKEDFEGMINPLFEAMLELGYTESQLRHGRYHIISSEEEAKGLIISKH